MLLGHWLSSIFIQYNCCLCTLSLVGKRFVRHYW